MEEKPKKYEEIFEQVMALYSSLREANEFRVKRAEMRQGECAALPIDFCADVDVKAVRALFGDGYAINVWHATVENTLEYRRMPTKIKQVLGKAFSDGHLGPTGDYRSLYARRRDD